MAGGEVVSDLVAFLRARLDEEETLARAADDPTPWPQRFDWPGSEDVESQCRFVEAWSPSRVLADVAAKREMLARLEDQMPSDDDPWWTTCSAEDFFAQQAVACVALPYADHPDYQSEWREWKPTTKDRRQPEG